MNMATIEMKMILNEELPADLRKELEDDARMRDLTLNDAATRVLSQHFGIEWSSSGRGFRETSERFKLRVSEELHRELRVQAADRMQTIRGITLNTLSTHYQTEIVEPNRRPRRQVA
jgi:HicB family.